MLPDDVFRDRLEATLVEVEAWAAGTRDVASIDVTATSHYWRMVVVPQFAPACPFEVMISSDQKFNLKIASEVYQNRAIERFDFFPKLAKAIEAGHVERIEISDAATGLLSRLVTRIDLDPAWTWIGERRIGPEASSEEWRARRYLPYRR